MTTAQVIRANGFKSLAQFSRLVGVPVSTLKDWHTTKTKLFNMLIAGAKCAKETDQ